MTVVPVEDAVCSPIQGAHRRLPHHVADEVDDGELIFMSIDLQDQANKALVEKYGAYTSQLFMNKVTNGVEEIEQITSVWFYLGNNQAFADAFKAEIDKRLE